MTSEGLGEMFKVYFADMCAEKILLVLMGWVIDPIKHALWGS